MRTIRQRAFQEHLSEMPQVIDDRAHELMNVFPFF